MIALHAALLAGKAGRPVRMIYDRHEDLAATTKRHPAIVRHRTGVTRDGRLLAQDIEVVMDGGAYCTLTPVVLSRGAIHAGGPYRCPNVRIRAPGDADQHAAQRGVPRVRRAADRVRRRDPPQPDRRGPRAEPARDPAPERLSTRRHDPDRPGPADERRRRGGPRARRRGRRVRTAARPPRGGTRPAGGLRDRSRFAVADRPGPAGHGCRPGAGLARRRVHRLGRGQARIGGVARADRRRPHRHPGRLDRDGPGHEDDLPAAGRRRPGRAVRGGRDRAPGHRVRPGFRTDRRVPDGDGRRRAAHPGGRPAARTGRGGDGRHLRGDLPGLRPREGRAAGRPALRAVSGRRLRRRDLPRRRLPGVRLGGLRCVASRSISTRARSTSATWSPSTTSGGSSTRSWPRARSRAARSRPSATPRSRRSSCATGATSTTAWRPTSSRPSLDAPRITTILVEAPFDGVPHGAKGVGELPMDVGAPAVVAAIADATGAWIARPAGQPGADPGRARGRPGGRAAATRSVRTGAPGRRLVTHLSLHGQRRPGRGGRPRHAPPAGRRCARISA